jgi:hypothetical protein
VRDGNGKVARQAADQIGMYMQHNIRVLQSVGTELGAAKLAQWQQQRILIDVVLDFPEFREITLFDRTGSVVATSAVGATRLAVAEQARQRPEKPYIAPLTIHCRRRRSRCTWCGRSRTAAGSWGRLRSKPCGAWSAPSVSAARVSR